MYSTVKSWKGDVNYTYPVGSVPVNIRPMTNKDYSNNITNKFGLPKPIKHYRKGRTIINYNIPDSDKSWQQLNSAVKSTSRGYLISNTIDKPAGNYTISTESTSNCLNCDVNSSGHVINALVNNTTTITNVPEKENITNYFCCNSQKNALKRVRPASTNLSKNYYTTLQQYRQARCKTYDQKVFNFESTTENLPENTYLAHCYPNTAACKLSVYKPNNIKYSQQGSVSSSLNTMNKNVETITSNAYSLNKTTQPGGNPFILKMKTDRCNPKLQNPHPTKTICSNICNSNC